MTNANWVCQLLNFTVLNVEIFFVVKQQVNQGFQLHRAFFLFSDKKMDSMIIRRENVFDIQSNDSPFCNKNAILSQKFSGLIFTAEKIVFF